jgi:ribosomal protein S4E
LIAKKQRLENKDYAKEEKIYLKLNDISEVLGEEYDKRKNADNIKDENTRKEQIAERTAISDMKTSVDAQITLYAGTYTDENNEEDPFDQINDQIADKNNEENNSNESAPDTPTSVVDL